jgi:hypothetical protein
MSALEHPVERGSFDTDPDVVPFTYTKTGLFAVIKKSSKYRDQQPRCAGKEGVAGAMPFPVSFVDYATDYCVSGNSNSYRIADLHFYVKCRHGWVRLS